MRCGGPGPVVAAIVLACASRPYFAELLGRRQAYPLLLTTGLMAAAAAYDRHQRCGSRVARRLFSLGSE